MPNHRHAEGLKAARLLMVLSSISPLFIIWAIKGNKLIPDFYFVMACISLAFAPNLFLLLRIKTAVKLEEKYTLDIGTAEDHRDHLLVYLFTMLLPFYTTDIGTWRDLAAALVALIFIIFLFWHLNLHYMNILFAACGYRVFTIYAPVDENAFTGRDGFVLITRRVSISPGCSLDAYRLSDTVYLEVQNEARF